MSQKSARRRAREYALQGLYQWLLSQEESGVVNAHIRSTVGFEKADSGHFDLLLSGAINQAETLRELFGPFIDRPVTELSPVEHAILLFATYELVNCAEIPYKVVINEAVEVAKQFGGTDGFKYVNGVLDQVAAQVRPLEFRK
ncbi:transcription antitermination factor NusB [Parvibium lacunae]|uniref:Transcription antitermination protein NusB n=1 Tax=Parvibium lacunae TaxID=1888893 RepID=A0A368L4N6_9BURK|nr:transcription antitermination factor NusB [Parvibium lacunae]RCS58539.1 transcription antitermination factor NusB [Parvibium lacunae]